MHTTEKSKLARTGRHIVFFGFVASACLAVQPVSAAVSSSDGVVAPGVALPSGTALLETTSQLMTKAELEWQSQNHQAVIDTLTDVLARTSVPAAAVHTALLNRGNAYLHLNQPGLALADFKALENLKHPEKGLVHLLQAMAHERLGDLPSAASHYVKALQLAPTDARVNRHIQRFFNKK